MKFVSYFLIVLSMMLMLSLAWWAGRQSGIRRLQKMDLRTVGLSVTTVRRYREVMTLLNGMVAAVSLDGPYAGNVLTPDTEREICRILVEHRKEMGIDQ